jgi:tetratricopeptide (TPR) repeat protein
VLQRVPGRYRLHDLIRLHAHVLAEGDPADARDAAVGRLLDYYQFTAGRADALISPIPRDPLAGPGPAHGPVLPDADAARTWLRAERPNLLAALRYATGQARPERGVMLTAGLASLLRDDGPWSEALALHTDAIAAARSAGDQAGRAAALVQLGIIRSLTGDCPGWLDDLEQALRLYQQLGSVLGQANALARLSNIRRYTGDYPAAIPGLEQALRLYQQLGDRNGQAKMLISLGNAQRLTGDFAGAARNLQESLRLNGHLGNQLGRANALSELGELERLTGHYPDAARYLEQGLAIFQDLGNQQGQANAQAWLASVRHATGDLPAAAQLLEAAMETFRRIGSRGSEAWALNRYAAVISATGDPAKAEALYLDALQLARETRQFDDEAFALEGTGEHLLRRNHTTAGVAHLQQALEIFQRMAMRPDADRVQARLARVSHPGAVHPQVR